MRAYHWMYRWQLCTHALLGAMWIVVLCPQTARAAPKLRKVTLQLKWKHQYQFAGYYMAREAGLYRKAGLDVTIVEGGPTVDVVERVVQKKADFGVGTSALLLDYAAGKPVVVLGVIYQHSPLVLLMKASLPSHSLGDLVGKPVMVEPHSGDILAMLKIAGVDKRHLRLIPHSGQVDSLVKGDAAAISAYLTDEPFLLDRSGLRYTTFNPRTFGIDFYGDNFFTRKELVDKHPAMVSRFRRATIEGWKLALADPARAIALIRNRYSTRKSAAHLRFESTRTRFLMTELVEPGYMNRRRWEYISETYLETGLLESKPNLDAFVYVEAAKPVSKRFHLPQWFWPVFFGALLLLAMLTGSSVYFKRLNTQLRAEMRRRRQADSALSESSTQLSQALQEIKTLKGILPICSHCNKIRDEEGDWEQLESYITSHSEAEFSHGICQDCMREHYGDILDD